jgi:DNA invertase Pin-like site-specific DNA recombinase
MSEHIGYIRVSSEGQNTDRQLADVKLDHIYIDKVSGATKDRPQLNACLSYIRKGDTLHVHSIDRLARSLRDLQEIVDSLVSRNITVQFHSEHLIFTSEENPVSTMMLQMLGMIAQFERTLTRKRQREGIDTAKAKGKHIGRPKIDMNRRGEAIDLSKLGLSISAIARQMKLSRTAIYKLLS